MATPDALTIMTAILSAQPAVTGIVSDRIAPDLGDDLPAIRTGLVTGDQAATVAEPGEYDPEVAVECWATDEATASQLAKLVRDVFATPTAVTGVWDGAYLAGADVSVEPFSSFDTTGNLPRYVLQVRLVTFSME